MSLAFSDTTNKNGIIQQLEKRCLLGDAGISGNATLLKQITGDVNLALDKAFSIIFGADGRWQFDDSNQTGFPIITTALVSGQRDYTFVSDGESTPNLILEIHAVYVRVSATGVYTKIEPVDVEGDGLDTDSFTSGLDTTGTPYRYDKKANSVFLDPIPNYASTDGLKVYISREGSYFTSSDTTKKAGFYGLYHEYLVLRPAYQYAYTNQLNNVNSLEKEMLKMEADLRNAYTRRSKDERNNMTMKPISFR